MFYMHVNWLMFIGVEVEDESEIFVYLRHIFVIISRCKDTNLLQHLLFVVIMGFGLDNKHGYPFVINVIYNTVVGCDVS